MSLKRYLFLLVSLLIIALAAIQLSFVSYIQGQIEQEIQDRSQTLSERVIEFVAQELEPPVIQVPAASTSYSVENRDVLEQFYHVKIHPPKKQIIEINEQYSMEIGESQPIIELIPKDTMAPAPPSLKSILKNIKVMQNDNDSGFSLRRTTGDGIEQQSFEFDDKKSLSSHYFNYLSVFIISLSLVGLLLAYWLARHISRPLNQLTGGFQALAAGELGVVVKADGVKEVKQTLTRFNQMSQQLEQLSKQEQQFIQAQHMADIGEMTRGLAHALRNPINTIGLSLEQMAQPNLSNEQRQLFAKGAREKINSMDNTIKSLLTLATQQQIAPQPIDLLHIIQDISLEIAATNQTPVTYANRPLPFIGHESELRAILHSVMVNAVEACKSQGSVDIISEFTSDGIILKIIDSGSGIAPQLMDKLFQPHVTSKAEGAGMGLYIARRLCQLHYHGQLDLTNNASGGATATIELHSISETTHE